MASETKMGEGNQVERIGEVEMNENGKPKIADLETLLERARGKDKTFALELRTLVDALVDKMVEARARGLVCQISLDNGEASNKPTLTYFGVRKILDEWTNPEYLANQQQPRGVIRR